MQFRQNKHTPRRIQPGEGMMKEFMIECTKVSFREATCIIDGGLMDCLYIIEESNGYKDASIVTTAVKCQKTKMKHLAYYLMSI